MEEKSNIILINLRANKEEIKLIPRMLSSRNQNCSEAEGNKVADKKTLKFGVSKTETVKLKHGGSSSQT